MKKILLTAAIAATALSMSANDYFEVKFDGNVVPSGNTVNVRIESEAIETPVGTMYVNEAAAFFDIVLKTTDAQINIVDVYAEDPDQAIVTGNPATYGTLTCCFDKCGVDGTGNNCLNSLTTPGLFTQATVAPGSTVGKDLQWQFHIQNPNKDASMKYRFEFTSAEGPVDSNTFQDLSGVKRIENSKYVVYVQFSGDSAVDVIESDENAAPVYFDLQGRQVANPEAGLFIVKRGNKVAKEFIR